jgi:hypothetical protein
MMAVDGKPGITDTYCFGSDPCSDPLIVHQLGQFIPLLTVIPLWDCVVGRGPVAAD